MSTLTHRPAAPRGTKAGPLGRQPSLIDWRLVGGTAACAAVFLAGALVAAWFASRPAKAPMERSAPPAMESTRYEPVPVARPTEEPAPRPPQPAATPVAEQPPLPPAPEVSQPALVPAPAPPACETFGTRVQFVSNPTDAGRAARQENKLLFVLHISGNFEDDKFT